MVEVRYFGVAAGQADFDVARGDAAGRFLPLAEPLPVGTEVTIDGVRHRVTRVEEGASPGFWVQSLEEGAAAVPAPIEAEATVPSPAPAAPSATVDAVPEPVAAEASAPTEATGSSEPSGNDEGGKGGKRKRRNKKTVLGR